MRETAYDAASFAAGQDTGTRVAACVARYAALELVESARWWDRWRCRLMASALVACAEDLEQAADEAGRERDEPVSRRGPLSLVTSGGSRGR
jgi:hypothetical protein